MRRQLTLHGDRILGRLVKWLIRAAAPRRPRSRLGFLRRRGAADWPLSAGASDRPGQSARRVPGQGRGLDRGDTAGRLGKPWPGRRRVCASGAHLGLRSRRIPNTGRIQTDSVPLFDALRTDGKPALCFAAHLANWELPAIAAAAHGLPSAVVYRMPNNKAVAREIVRIRAPLMGRLIRTRAQAALEMAAALDARRAPRHAGGPAFFPRRRRHVLWPALQGQPLDRPSGPPVRLPGGRRPGDPPARPPVSHRGFRAIRAAQGRKWANRCRGGHADDHHDH